MTMQEAYDTVDDLQLNGNYEKLREIRQVAKRENDRAKDEYEQKRDFLRYVGAALKNDGEGV